MFERPLLNVFAGGFSLCLLLAVSCAVLAPLDSGRSQESAVVPEKEVCRQPWTSFSYLDERGNVVFASCGDDPSWRDAAPLDRLAAFSGYVSYIHLGEKRYHKSAVLSVVWGKDVALSASLPDYFLYRFESLTAVDLSLFEGVEKVGDSFLSCCYSLSSLDISPLSALNAIPAAFLSHCKALSFIDLYPLRNAASIGPSFLSDTSVSVVSFCSFSRLSSIGEGFLRDCKSLSSVVFPPSCRLSSIGPSFLSGCSSLPSLDLSGVSADAVGCFFLADCSSLLSVAIPDLPIASFAFSPGSFALDVPHPVTLVLRDDIFDSSRFPDFDRAIHVRYVE